MSGRTASGMLSTRDTVPSATSAARATSTTVGGMGCFDFAAPVCEFSIDLMKVKADAQGGKLGRAMKESTSFPVFHPSFHARPASKKPTAFEKKIWHMLFH